MRLLNAMLVSVLVFVVGVVVFVVVGISMMATAATNGDHPAANLLVSHDAHDGSGLKNCWVPDLHEPGAIQPHNTSQRHGTATVSINTDQTQSRTIYQQQSWPTPITSEITAATSIIKHVRQLLQTPYFSCASLAAFAGQSLYVATLARLSLGN